MNKNKRKLLIEVNFKDETMSRIETIIALTLLGLGIALALVSTYLF